ncbi:MAG TPA: hypothetical protein VNI02_01770 [Blastocatellia bacterium]|nr:hypothetical protein [Blastocatellia bacterium]
MRKMIAVIFGVFAAALALTPGLSAYAQDKPRDKGDLPEREEIRQSYQIAPGARVEIANINGPLEIETVSGNTAEIYVVRSARSKADLEYRKIIVENTPTSFRLYSQEPEDGLGNNITVRHRAVLKLPRPSALSVRNINGSARVGDVDGPITLGNINGPLEIGQATEFAELSNINGNMGLTIVRLGERGIRLRNVNGNINLRFLNEVNADLEVRSFNGTVNSSLPNLSVQKTGRSDFRGQIGAGGTPITGSHINGVITIRGASDGTR